MIGDDRANPSQRDGNDGRVCAFAATGRPARQGAVVGDDAFHFQARKRSPPGALSRLIPRAPGRRLPAMIAYTTAPPAHPVSAATDWHAGALPSAKRLAERRARHRGRCPPALDKDSAAGRPSRGRR